MYWRSLLPHALLGGVVVGFLVGVVVVPWRWRVYRRRSRARLRRARAQLRAGQRDFALPVFPAAGIGRGGMAVLWRPA